MRIPMGVDEGGKALKASRDRNMQGTDRTGGGGRIAHFVTPDLSFGNSKERENRGEENIWGMKKKKK